MRPSLRLFVIAAGLVTGFAAQAHAGLEQVLEGRLRAADLGPTRVSLFAYDLDTGDTLAQINPDARLIPASNMKLVTTAAALVNLGPDFVFRTELRLLAAEDDAQGGPTLVVHGDGDPAFCDPVILEQHGLDVDEVLDRWVEQVAATGHTRFERLVIDDRVFDRDFTHPTWPSEQLIYRWCAPVAGLNFYQNLLDVLPQPTSYGQAPVVALYPAEADRILATTNRATTGNSESFWVSRTGEDAVTFHGSVKNRRSTPIQVTLPDPPLFFGKVFAQRLADRGVTVGGVARPRPGDTLPAGKVLHRMQTTLPLVLERTNQDSQNMFAEALLKRMGRKITGRPGGFDNGAAAVRIAMQKLLGPRASVLTVADGSGMSRDNRVSTRFVAELLIAMHHHDDPAVAEAFASSLAVGGENGTLRRRFRRFNDGEVLGKSGYLRGVSALSGYLVMPDHGDDGEGRTVVFSMLFNGFEPPLTNANMKRIQEEFIRVIEDAYDQRVHLGG